MKTSSWCALLALGLLQGCVEEGMSQRYRAERDLWLADRARQELPSPAGRNRPAWTALALSYEQIARTYGDPGLRGEAAAPFESIAGRALLSASELRAASFDSIRSIDLLEELAERPSLPSSLAALVAIRRASLFEREGHPAEAIELFEFAISGIEWTAESLPLGRLSSSLLELPLRLSRLHARVSGLDEVAAARERARRCYAGILEAPDVQTRIGAHRCLVELALDERSWDTAIALLDTLAVEFEKIDDPRFDPNETRRRTLEVMHLAWVEDGIEPTGWQDRFYTLLETDPLGRYAAPALLNRAEALARMGEPRAAIDLITQLLSTYRRSPVRPQARLLEARIEERTGRWRDALVAYRTVHNEFPLEPEGLLVAVEMARHHLAREDWAAASLALQEAEEQYREVIARFPEGPHTRVARARLVETLELLGRPRDMLEELLVWSDTVAHTAEEITLLVRAGRLARVELGDRARAIEIYQRLAERFPGTRTGAWSSREVDRLRRSSEWSTP